MISKSDLQSYRMLVLELEDLKERIIRKESQITSARIQVLTGMPRGGGGEEDQIGSAIAAMEKMKNEYVLKMHECEEKLFRIESEINKLHEYEKLIMRLRYIDGEKWEEICLKLNYGWAQIHRIHANILRKLSKDDTQ